MLVKDTNKGKIEAMIKEAEGRARVRTITYKDIANAVNYLENRLEISKKAMLGVRARIDVNAQSFPRGYKYSPESTHFTVIKTATGWDLVDISRDYTQGPTQQFMLTLTDAAKDAIIWKKSSFGGF